MLLSLSLRWPGLGLVPMGALVGLWRFASSYRLAIRSTPRFVLWFFPISLLAVASGLLLGLVLPGSAGSSTSLLSVAQVSVWMLAFPIEGIAGAAAFRHLGFARGATWVSLGALLGNLVYYGLDFANPWKYVLAFPLSLLVFATVGRFRPGKAWLGFAAAPLVIYSFMQDSRSAGSAVVMALGIALLPKARNASRLALVRQTTLLAVVGVAFIMLLIQAMAAGYLGESIKATYDRQTRFGERNPILAGRVEWHAVMYLAQARPIGYGMGRVPNSRLQDGAIAQVVGASGNSSETYFERAVFADRVDLHSVSADLWYYSGIAGVGMALIIALILMNAAARSMLRSQSANGLAPFVLLLVVYGLWALLFSPMSQLDQLGIALAVAIGTLMSGVSDRDFEDTAGSGASSTGKGLRRGPV